jgi:hypothetical protein
MLAGEGTRVWARSARSNRRLDARAGRGCVGLGARGRPPARDARPRQALTRIGPNRLIPRHPPQPSRHCRPAPIGHFPNRPDRPPANRPAEICRQRSRSEIPTVTAALEICPDVAKHFRFGGVAARHRYGWMSVNVIACRSNASRTWRTNPAVVNGFCTYGKSGSTPPLLTADCSV